MQTEKARCVEVALANNPGQQSWLAGEPLRDGQTLQLVPGCYPVLVRVDLGKVPRVIKCLPMSLRFTEVTDPAAAMDAWLAQIDSVRSRLQRLLEQLGPGTERLRIQRLLSRSAAER